LSAVARPQPGFDGKLGIWRVAKNYTAMRDSKSHKRGDVYEKDRTMASDDYFKMMQEQVFPSIIEGFSNAPNIKHVRVQQDKSRPHTGKNVVDGLNAIGATLTPIITVVTQPAHSPDMHVNDLGLFRALDVKVQRCRRGMKRGRMDPEQLARDVVATYAAFKEETLEKIWESSIRDTS